MLWNVFHCYLLFEGISLSTFLFRRILLVILYLEFSHWLSIFQEVQDDLPVHMAQLPRGKRGGGDQGQSLFHFLVLFAQTCLLFFVCQTLQNETPKGAIVGSTSTVHCKQNYCQNQLHFYHKQENNTSNDDSL
jgi:hypothetical protein